LIQEIIVIIKSAVKPFEGKGSDHLEDLMIN